MLGIPTTIDWQVFAKRRLEEDIMLVQYNPAGGEHDGFGPPVRQRSKLPLWSRLAHLSWIYGSLKILVLQVLQHKYNLIARELKTMNKSSPTSAVDGLETGDSVRQSELAAELSLAVSRIEMIGNPGYEVGFAVEILFVFALVLFYIVKAQMPLYVAWRGPTRIGVIQMLLEPKRELEQVTRRQIDHLESKFVSSIGYYWQARTKELIRIQTGCGHLEAPPLSGQAITLHAIGREHERALGLARALVAGNQLAPPNRQAEWTRQAAKLYGQLYVSLTLLSFSIIFGMLVVLPYSGILNFKIHYEHWRAIFAHFEMIVFASLAAKWTIFYLILLIMIAVDQIKFERELSRIIEFLIQSINLQTIELVTQARRYRSACAPLPGQDIQDISQKIVEKSICHKSPPYVQFSTTTTTTAPSELECCLLRVLGLYKLFKCQLRAAQPTVGFISAHMVFLMLLLPIMGRFYGAHINPEERFILLMAALFFILACDSVVALNCMIHARCLRLFKLLSQLLAHIDRLAATHRQRNNNNDDDRDEHERDGDATEQACDQGHTVWLLRRELRMPDIAMRRFATRALLINLTYASWLGVHFWCGLLLAPLCMGDPARLGSAGVPLVDSLGLF